MTKATAEQFVNIRDTNFTEIDKNSTNDNAYKPSSLIEMSDNTSIASQSTCSLANTDSGFSVCVLNGIEHFCIISNSVLSECTLSVSPCFHHESWSSGIQTTSTPFTESKDDSYEQNVCKTSIDKSCAQQIFVAKKNAKILEFENEPQQGNQDSGLEKTNEAAGSKKSSCSLHASTETNCEKLDNLKIIEEQLKPSGSLEIIESSSTEIVSEIRQNENAAKRLINVTYRRKNCAAVSQLHNATYCFKNGQKSENMETIEEQARPICSSKTVKFPSLKKVSQIRADENRVAIRKSRVLTSEGRRRSGRFVSMAEAMRRFQTMTPKRFHTKPRIFSGFVLGSNNRVPERNSSRGASSSSSNIMRRKIKSKLKAEENDSAMPSCSGAMKKIASPIPFSDSFEERNKRLLKKRKEIAEKCTKTEVQSYVFHARPMPKFTSPKVEKSRKRLTNPQTPMWARKKKK